jgi:hypothetical protein
VAGCETQPRYGEVRVHDRDLDVRVVFTDHDRESCATITGSTTARCRPASPKRARCRPATRMRVTPALAARRLLALPAPGNVERQLSRLPDGYVRVIVGSSIAIMNVRTRVIFDVIENIHD